ncbi:MAG: ribbon-helix-helix protein, CopG family [Spirochaetaceae bacterium]
MAKGMVRSQIQFPREQLENIRAIARSEGISIAEVVRRAVDHYAEHKVSAAREETLRSRAGAVVGRYASGYGDTSTDHDRRLAEAYRTDEARE